MDACDAVDELLGSSSAVPPPPPREQQDDDFDTFKDTQQTAENAALTPVRVMNAKSPIEPTPRLGESSAPRLGTSMLDGSASSKHSFHTPQSSQQQERMDYDTVCGQSSGENNNDTDEINNSNNKNTAKDDTTNATTIAQPSSRRYVSSKDFELLKVIGMGAFGKVLQVRNKRTQQVLAMKVISKRILRKKGDGMMENILAERNILHRVRHYPFVVSMHCSFQSREKLFIIMDFLAGGELFLRLGREGIFLERTAAFYLAEIILALDHLHSLGVLHRDLKPENILLGSDGHVCLTDFGLAKDFGLDGFSNEDARTLTVCGTTEYMAPEMVARQGYGRAADYWSLGCIAYEMLKGLPPFQSKQGAKALFSKIMTEKVKMPPGSSAEACKLLKGLLNRNVQARLGTTKSTMFEVGGVAALKKAAFFADIDWDKLERKEITPPAVFSVENDGDVQHFHDEFTKMALPRSVKEMTADDFQPRRVASDAFRGFSFIHEDFLLPDRDATEEKTYWEKIEEDGQSDSDCASSKFEGEGKDEIEPTVAQNKKKRPPRKRKKKKPDSAATTPAGTATNTPSASALNTPDPSEAGDLADKLDGLVLDDHTVLTPKIDSTTIIPVVANPPTPQTPAHPLPPVQSTPTPKPKQDIWQVSGGKQKSTAKSKKKTTANSTASSPALSGRATQPTNGSRAGVAPKRYPIGQTPQQHQRVVPSHSRGGWGSPAPSTPHRLQVGPAGQAFGRNSLASPATPRGVGAKSVASPTASPSSDWRNHSMSPLDSNGRPIVKAPTKEPSWPSLGGPPLSKNQVVAKPKVVGAWASRVGK